MKITTRISTIIFNSLGLTMEIPEEIRHSKRDYVLWILSFEGSKKFMDFTKDPWNIGKGTLSPVLKDLLAKKLVERILEDNSPRYVITEKGEDKFLGVLDQIGFNSELLLEKKVKRVHERNIKIRRFLEKYRDFLDFIPENAEIFYRLYQLTLKINFLNYEQIFQNEEEFFKILLFISFNHPSNHSRYISEEDFCKLFKVKLNKLKIGVDKILQDQRLNSYEFIILPVKNQNFYLEKDDELGQVLYNSLTTNIEKFSLLEHLNLGLDLRILIVNDLIYDTKILHEDFEDALKIFIEDFTQKLARRDISKILKEKKPGYLLFCDKCIKKEKSRKLSTSLTQNLEENDLDSKVRHAIVVSASLCDNLEEYEKALEEVEKGLRINKESIELLINKAIILNHMDKFEEALESFEKAESLVDKDDLKVQILGRKAEILKQNNQFELALKNNEETLNLVSKNDEFRFEMIHQRAEIFMENEQYDMALKILKNLMKELPEEHYNFDNISIIIDLATCFSYVKNYEKSLEFVDIALSFGSSLNIEQKFYLLNLKLLDLISQNIDIKEAIDFINSSDLKNYPEAKSNAYIWYSQLLIDKKGEFEKALESFEIAIKNMPKLDIDVEIEQVNIPKDIEILKNWARKEENQENLERIYNLEKEFGKIGLNPKT